MQKDELDAKDESIYANFATHATKVSTYLGVNKQDVTRYEVSI
jgi:hypothetical protein